MKEKTHPSKEPIGSTEAIGWNAGQQVFVLISIALMLGAAVMAVIQWRHDPVKDLDSDDPEVRLVALDELAGEKSLRATQAIAAATADPVDRVAARALMLLGPRAEAEDIKKLTKAVTDKRPLVREAAVVALGQFRLRRLIDAKILFGVLKDPKEEAGTRAAAARSLARLNVWTALPELVEALKLGGREHKVIRERAAVAAQIILGCELKGLQSQDRQEYAIAVSQVHRASRSTPLRQSHQSHIARLEKQAAEEQQAASTIE